METTPLVRASVRRVVSIRTSDEEMGETLRCRRLLAC